MIRGKMKLRALSVLTILFFVASTFGAYAQQVPAAAPTTSSQVSNVVGMLGAASPEIQMLTSNLGNMEGALKQIEQISSPLYNKIVPSNMEAMSIGERVKAIIGNTKDVVQTGVQSYKGKVADWNQANGITPNTSFEEELGVGLNQLGVEAGKMPMDGKGNALVEKLKIVVNAIKAKMQQIIAVIKAKVIALAQKFGLKKKTDSATEEKGPVKEDEGIQPSMEADVQYADNFSGKLSKGVAEGTKNAKQSLKNSFSFSNLAVTTGVAVGTNLALQVIKGEKPSFGKAARAVASLEFAGSVVGGALGSAGGQFCSTLVRTFMPGPIGAMIGAFVPVVTGSFGAQMGTHMASGAKAGDFSVSRAWQMVDKVDLVGSSIGSTIGMALGAPIPIIGPIIGGILGGVIGSKIAKWAWPFIKGTRDVGSILRPGQSTGTVPNSRGGEISIGAGANPTPVMPNTPRGVTSVSSEVVPAASSDGSLANAERKYYEAYLQYNRLVEQGKYDDAKKIYGDLKTYSDQYNTLKNQTK
jgi:hypothetical protein